MKKLTKAEKMAKVGQGINANAFAKYQLNTIAKYSTDTYTMSRVEALCLMEIRSASQLKDHCFTSSTSRLEYITYASRSTIVRALKRLEEQNIILKFETTTRVPYYVPRDLYYARVYHRIDLKKYYPENIVDIKPEFTKLKEFYNGDIKRINNQLIHFMKELKVEEIKLDKELKSAPFLPNKAQRPTVY